MTARHPELGSSLGRYRLLEELGRGGMAVVYRAEDPALQREVAIKVLHAHLWDQPEYARRFVREARAVARLRHPNIVEVYDYGDGDEGEGDGDGADRGAGFIVVELVRGPTLREFVEQRGVLLPEVAAMVALKLAEALSCAHDEGIVHRDLKPDNVIIAEGGRVVLTDFGIARILEGESVTQTGALLGSPGYMSPEQARGERVDARSDLFSLGTLLYQLCTGRLPFLGKDPISTVLKILDGKPEPALSLNPTVGRPLDRLIARLMQPQPEERPQSAREAASALAATLAEVGLSDVDAELGGYFAQPGPYNATLIARVISTSLTRAREAAAARQIPRALSLCDRVLAFEGDNAEALKLLEQVSARRGTRIAIAVAAMVALLLGGGFFGWRWLAGGPDPAQVRDGGRAADQRLAVIGRGAPAREARPAPDSGPADAARPDRARDRQPADGDRARPRPGQRRRHPRPPRPDARPAAPADAAPARDATRAVAPRPPTVAPKGPGKLLVTIGPWCNLRLDGKPAGRSPMKAPIVVAPGRHVVVCRQGEGAPADRRVVQVPAGQTVRVGGLLRATVRVRLSLGRGDAVRIDGRRHVGELRLPPTRHRIDVLSGTRVVTGGWVTIPARDCTLVDQPSLRCR